MFMVTLLKLQLLKAMGNFAGGGIINVFVFNTVKYKFGDVSTKRACELCTESRRIYICRIERNKRLV